MVSRPTKVVLVSLSVVLLVTGCWDRKEIETRGIVLGVAIDKVPQQEAKAILQGQPLDRLQSYELTPGLTPTPLYRMTLQLPVIKRAKQAGQVGGGGGAEAPATWNISGIGVSLFAIQREMATRVTIQPFFEHLQVIVISEAAAKDGLNNYIDFFFRSLEIRRQTRVFVTPQEAISLLELHPQIEDYAALYLNNIPLNSKYDARIASRTDIGEISERLHNGVDFVLPKVVSTGREAKVAGGAVFKGDKLVGWVEEDELASLKYVRNFVEGDWITVPCPIHPPGALTVDVNRASAKTKLEMRAGKPSFIIQVAVGGNITENNCKHNDKDFDPGFLKAAGEQVCQILKSRIENSLKKVQAMKADVLGLGGVIEREQPGLWKQIMNQWGDEMYPSVEVKVEVQTQLRLTGAVRNSPNGTW